MRNADICRYCGFRIKRAGDLGKWIHVSHKFFSVYCKEGVLQAKDGTPLLGEAKPALGCVAVREEEKA